MYFQNTSTDCLKEEVEVDKIKAWLEDAEVAF